MPTPEEFKKAIKDVPLGLGISLASPESVMDVKFLEYSVTQKLPKELTDEISKRVREWVASKKDGMYTLPLEHIICGLPKPKV